MSASDRTDIHHRITQQIVAAIEAGAGDYKMPWHTSDKGGLLTPRNSVGRYKYHGINILCLWASQHSNGYRSFEWATYSQWKSIGAQVRKGETATPTVFYKPLDAKQDSSRPGENGSEPPTPGTRRVVIRATAVFNADQVDGYTSAVPRPLSDSEPHHAAEELIATSGAKISFNKQDACYLPSRDEIHLPAREAFSSPAAFYSVAFHELTHWTGHAQRCARDLTGRFGGASYAMEELVAELGAAFMLAEVGVTAEPRVDHAQYISSWLKALNSDPRAIFIAAAKASQASVFLSTLLVTDMARRPRRHCFSKV